MKTTTITTTTTTTSAMTDREDKVYKAKLAEQAERYDGETVTEIYPGPWPSVVT